VDEPSSQPEESGEEKLMPLAGISTCLDRGLNSL